MEKSSGQPNPFAYEVGRAIEKRDYATLLDVGCGDGRDSIYFAEQGLKVTSVDFSESGLERLREKNPAIQAHLGDIRHLDFPENSFDIIYAHLSLHYFDEETTKNIFAKKYKILKPGGMFFVKCKSTKDPFFGQGEKIAENMYMLKHVRHFFSPEYMAEQLTFFVNPPHIQETTAEYENQQSCFVEAIATKPKL